MTQSRHALVSLHVTPVPRRLTLCSARMSPRRNHTPPSSNASFLEDPV